MRSGVILGQAGQCVGVCMSFFELNYDEFDQAEPVSVMICETSQVQLRMLGMALDEAGFSVRVSNSAESALSALRDHPCDIFLTAIELAEMSGLEACWALKSDRLTSHIHTIILTASSDVRRLEESFDSGADDFIRKPIDMIELRARMRAAARLVRMQRSLRRMAETDALTGALNRRAFFDRFDDLMQASRVEGKPLSVVMADLDHFKRINDTHGHAAGDQVLIDSVSAMTTQMQSSDSLGRLGGEEFGILLPAADEETASWLAEQLRARLEALEIYDADGEQIPITGSFGIATAGPGRGGFTCESLLHAADEALYAAKEGGRNRVIHSSEFSRYAKRAAG